MKKQRNHVLRFCGYCFKSIYMSTAMTDRYKMLFFVIGNIFVENNSFFVLPSKNRMVSSSQE